MLILYMSMIDDPQQQRKFERLYNTYRKTMFYVANRVLNDEYDAEDAVHQAFVRIIGHLDRIEEEDKWKTKSFLSIVVQNVAIDIYRKKKKEMEYTFSYDEYEVFIEDPNGQDFEKDGDLAKAIAKLPPLYADVIRLTYVHGYDSEEIGKLLGTTAENIRQRLVRARRKLAKILNGEE